jgi:adenylate cyclase
MRAAAKFCDECGASAQPSRPAERKHVTVLFGDVVGSMKLAATLDPEPLREIMYDLFNRSALVVQRYGGTVDKFTGDGLMALFGAPVALEDHAMRAAIAALEIHTAAAQLAEDVRERYGVDLQIRIGLNSGAVITGDIGSSYTAIGYPVGMAQRMEAAAPPGGTLCSASTATLIESTAALGPLEHVAVKNESDPVKARRLLGVTTEQRPMGRQSGAMLGRDSEMHNLLTAFAEAEKRGLLVGVVGSAGVGKSRLVAEFSSAAVDSGADPVVARCESHTAGVPLRALARLLRALFGVVRLDDAVARDRITDQLGAFLTSDSEHTRVLFELLGVAETGTAAPVLTPDAVRRRLVEVMATAVKVRSARTVLIIEDIHWIDEASAEILVDFTSALAATRTTRAGCAEPAR